MKAILAVDVYCPNGCGAGMRKTGDGRCYCETLTCKGLNQLFLQPTVDLLPDRLAKMSPSTTEPKKVGSDR